MSTQFAASTASCAGNISICYVHEDLFFDIYSCMYIITYRRSQAESGEQEQVNMRKSKAMEKPIDVRCKRMVTVKVVIGV